jgi:hypothetical protein
MSSSLDLPSPITSTTCIRIERSSVPDLEQKLAELFVFNSPAKQIIVILQAKKTAVRVKQLQMPSHESGSLCEVYILCPSKMAMEAKRGSFPNELHLNFLADIQSDL